VYNFARSVHGARHAVRHAQRCVLRLTSFFTSRLVLLTNGALVTCYSVRAWYLVSENAFFAFRASTGFQPDPPVLVDSSWVSGASWIGCARMGPAER
jgi:hypothetical protein